MIIDAHCHQWNLALGRHAWLDAPDAGPLRRTFDRADHYAASHGLPLDGTVCVQAEESAAELAWLRRPRTSPGVPVLGVVAAVDLCGPQLGAYVESFGDRESATAHGIVPVVGVRDSRMLATGPRPAPSTMALLAARGLTVDLLVPDPGRLGAAVDLVAAHPANSFVLDHLPQVSAPARTAAAHRAALGALAELPNLTVKVSGLRASPDSHGEPLRRLLAAAFGVFGPRRLMYGSDWPVSTPGRAPAASVDTLREHLPDLTGTEQDAFWHRTARTAYGLSPGPDAQDRHRHPGHLPPHTEDGPEAP
ncbi:amidohydrolase family protein [Streptomyces sp. NPDC002574]|uniref:amidohydrolase family protein n=1 Tax=Streptomyces sp. NPDC002574 TaxID=3364652 RepID=UPI0036BA78CF